MSGICTVCPRHCGVIREASVGKGFCKMGENAVVARVAKHMWEEPCISGTCGSGTVFFSGCVLKCVFCQNYKISTQNFGKELTPQQLADCYKRLEQQGVHNINLVNPTHFLNAVIESLNIYKPAVPVVYNCGGYESVESLKKLEGYIDIYLPDFKYADNTLAEKYSKVKNYHETAVAAIAEMLRQQPRNTYDNNGIMEKGVIVRHLILPSNTKNSIAALNSLHNHFGSRLTVSLMAQYIPCGIAEQYPEINRKITRREYQKVFNCLTDLDFDGFAQELNSAKSTYIPDFNLQGLE
ncbi:MAG: radical SAM protein [Ruminococcus sp.]|nr:radical SAM protein [Ruminococcus sp.]MDD6447335.1 radical SAM protein [Ruminococcus sp.]MDY2857151.1 radical SAM protein [Oscillospiraceae bacterium]